jgi:glycosyltransferase involved in cell wall biosynthesis
MHVLLVADNASHRFGGEAFIPLNYFRFLRSRGVDACLVVHARNRTELINQFPQDVDRLFFIEDNWLHKAFFRFGNRLPRRLAEATTGALIHLTTQWSQRRLIRKLVARDGFEVVHQPIPVSPKIPSLICGVGAPVIIGPLNGGMEYPPAFGSARGSIATLSVSVGRAAANLFNLLIPGKREAELILVANPRTRRALPWGIRGRVVEMVENGVDLAIWQKKSATFNNPIRLIYVGRLIDWKAVDIVLEAIQSLRPSLRMTFEIIGDGPMRQDWQNLVRRLGLEEEVAFSGFLPQPECARRLQESDIFVLPSLFECGGAVVLEAMATGLPVVATAWGGPLDYLDESCGILVEPHSREALIVGFAEAIKCLAQSSSLREQLGHAGYARARQNFDWERKIDQILELYAETSKRPSAEQSSPRTP